MVTIEDYLRLGYRGIVFLHREESEEKIGYQDEHTIHTLACYDKDGIPLKITMHWLECFRPNGGKRSCTIESKEVIGQEDYALLVKRYGVKDDSFYYQARAKKEKQKREAELKLHEMTPKCPICGNGMIIKHRNKDQQPFWSCVGFSKGKCRGSRSILKSDYSKFNRLLQIANQL